MLWVTSDSSSVFKSIRNWKAQFCIQPNFSEIFRLWSITENPDLLTKITWSVCCWLSGWLLAEGHTPPRLKTHIFLSSSPFLWYTLLMKTVRKEVILRRTYPLTFLKIASCRSLSFAESSSRLVLREGIHFWAFCPGVFPRNSLPNFEEYGC